MTRLPPDKLNGEGWATGPHGTRVWGRCGAAGLFLVTREPQPHVLLQHRAAWTNLGDTWGIPGGAIGAQETAVEGALRETREECGIDPADLEVLTHLVTAGPYPVEGWTYTTVIAQCERQLVTVANEESYELRWVPLAELAEGTHGLELLPPFADSVARVVREYFSANPR